MNDSMASESEVSSANPLTRGDSEKLQEARKVRADAMNKAISGNSSSDQERESAERETRDDKNKSTSEPQKDSQEEKDNDRENSCERGTSVVIVTAILTGME